jgi:hypothetical protein
MYYSKLAIYDSNAIEPHSLKFVCLFFPRENPQNVAKHLALVQMADTLVQSIPTASQ